MYLLIACSRLIDSRVRWIEKAQNENKTEGNWGEPAPPTFRVPFSFASSPLSESLEQANLLSDRKGEPGAADGQLYNTKRAE